jgi:hypothetical protein
MRATEITTPTVRERIHKVKNLLMYLMIEGVEDGGPVIHDAYQEVLAIEKDLPRGEGHERP